MTPRLPGGRPDQQHRNAATCLALMGLLGAAAGLLLLASLVLPKFVSYAFLVLLLLVGFFVLHYVTWGRRLSRMRDPEEDVEQDD